MNGAAASRALAGRDSWLGQRCPTVLLALLVLVSAVSVLILDIRTLGILYGALVVGVLATARIGVRRLLLAQIPFAGFGLGVVMVNALSRPGTELWPHLPVRVSAEGIAIGIALALRTLVIGVGAVAFTHVTEPKRLMMSLIRHAHVSPCYAYALLAGHRLLDTLPAQWRTLAQARLIRRANAPRGKQGRRLTLREHASCAFALLVGAIRSSERIAFTLESRGLAQGPRTMWKPVTCTWRDGAMAVAVHGAMAAVVVLGRG